MPDVPVSDAYLPLKALSAYSGLSVRTLRTHLTRPSAPLPHLRVGGKLLVRRSDFDAWVSQFRVAHPDVVRGLVEDALRGL